MTHPEAGGPGPMQYRSQRPLVEVDGVRVSGGGKHIIVWHQKPYRAAVVSKVGNRRWRRWQVLVYDGPPIGIHLICNKFRITRSGALATMAREFAKAGISVQGTLVWKMGQESLYGDS